MPTDVRGDDQVGGDRALPQASNAVPKSGLSTDAPWSNGRTLAVTRGEVRVRVRVPAGLPGSNEWTDVVGSNAGPDQDPGIEPRSNDPSTHSRFTADFLGPASGRSKTTD